MHRIFRVSAAFLGLVLFSVLIVASSAQATTSGRTQATTVTLSGWSAGKTEDDIFRTVVDAFNRTHRNVQIDYSVINGDYAPAMTARFAAHSPPDIFYVDSAVLPTWASQGVLQPLNSYVARSKFNLKPFYPGLLNAFKVGKNYYGFPKDWSPLATEINTAMFARAGIKTAPRTWAGRPASGRRPRCSGSAPTGRWSAT